MEPNGYTDEVANAIFATLASGKMGDALDGISAIGDALNAIAFDSAEIMLNDAHTSSGEELAKAAWAMVEAFNSIAAAIGNHAESVDQIADAIDQLAGTVGKKQHCLGDTQ